MRQKINEILERVQPGPIRAAKAVAESRAIRTALSSALMEEGQPDIAGQVFAVFVNPRHKRITVRWTPLESDTDDDAVTRFRTWVPIGYIVTVDTTRDGDEEITVFSTRKLLIEDTWVADRLAEAHLRVNAAVRDELSEVYREEVADIAQ